MTYYALRHKKYGLLGVSVTPNGDDAEFCNPASVEFSSQEENPWLTNCHETAISLRENRMPWYNSCMERPENPYKKADIEIIEVEIG